MAPKLLCPTNFYVQLLGRASRVQRRSPTELSNLRILSPTGFVQHKHTESHEVFPTYAYRVFAQAYRVQRDFSNISIQSPTQFVRARFQYEYGQCGTCLFAAREKRNHASLLAASPLLEAQPCIKRSQTL